jgi:hypothetical protein
VKLVSSNLSWFAGQAADTLVLKCSFAQAYQSRYFRLLDVAILVEVTPALNHTPSALDTVVVEVAKAHRPAPVEHSGMILVSISELRLLDMAAMWVVFGASE